jgi:hypothetical protein
MFENRVSLRFRDHCRQRRDIRLLYSLQAAEMFQQAASGRFSYAGDLS